MAKASSSLSPELEAQIIRAIKESDIAALKALLAKGFPLDAPLASEDGRTALAVARQYGSKANEIALALLDAGADWRKGQIDLIWAVYSKNEETTHFLIEHGADLNIKGRIYGPPLVMAASDPALIRIGQMLIDAGADINDGALTTAVRANNTGMALLLLKAGAMTTVDPELLTHCVFHRNAELARALIAGGADLNPRSTFGEWQDKDGRPAAKNPDGTLELRGATYVTLFSHATPLIIAAATGQNEVIDALIEAGADLYLGDAKGDTALDWAKRNGHTKVVAALEAAIVAKPRAADPGVELLLAAEKGDLPLVRKLIATGADLNARDTRPLLGGLTPLMHAARNGHTDIVTALLDAGADIAAIDDRDNQENAGFSFILNEGGIKHLIPAGYQLHRTVLHWAAALAQAGPAKILIDRGADLQAVDRAKMTPLLLAAEVGSTAIVADLLARGVNAHERGRKKTTALMLASRGGHIEVVRTLLAAGAQVDLKNDEGDTALIEAASRARSDVVALLLQAGANVHIANRRGEAAIQAITGSGLYEQRYKKGGFVLEFNRPQEEILKTTQLFIDAGADPSAKQQHSFSAQESAERALKVDPFYRDVIEILSKAKPREHAPATKPPKPKAPKKATKKKVAQEPVPIPDFTKASANPEFLAALADLEKRTGTNRQPLDQVPGGFAFHVHSNKADSFKLDQVQEALLKSGCFIFSIDHESNNRLAALPTTDKYDALLAMRTNAANEDKMPEDIVAWLRDLEKDHPFILTATGFDFLAGKFTTKITKPAQLVKKMFKFCSDVFEGADTESAAEALKKTGEFFFWWD